MGLVLLAFTAACGDLASVPYNAMLRQLTHAGRTPGRISGFGWAAGYLGSVALLVLIYAGFIAGSGPTRGLLGVAVDDGQNVRAAMLLAAGWFVLFAMPLLFTAHTFIPAAEPDTRRRRVCSGGYRQLWVDLRAEWRPRPQLRLLPDGQRGLPGRAGRSVRLRRGARASASTGSRKPTC